MMLIDRKYRCFWLGFAYSSSFASCDSFCSDTSRWCSFKLSSQRNLYSLAFYSVADQIRVTTQREKGKLAIFNRS